MKYFKQLIIGYFRLQEAAGSKFADFKELSATGLQFAVEKRLVMDLDIDISAPYVMVPYGGLFTRYRKFISKLGCKISSLGVKIIFSFIFFLTLTRS